MLVPAHATKALADYFDAIGALLGSTTRKESFAVYVTGLMSSIDRKTAETIAAMACTDPARMEAWHQQLLHIIADARWEDAPVRVFSAKYALQAAGAQERTDSWVIDDTGFPKQGTHSVGVGRQYSGTLGKIGNCQIGVTLQYATTQEVACLDADLYLPEESWGDDPDRLKAAGVPAGTGYRPKWRMGLTLLARAKANGF